MLKLDFAKKIVRESGQFLRENLDVLPEISDKGSFDNLVTNFDQQVQEKIVAQIRSNFPEDHIIAEENGFDSVKFDKVHNFWILDPIDGTINFVAQQENFAIMLAYYEAGNGKFGVIYDVVKDELYWSDDKNAYCNDEILTVKPQALKLSLLSINSYLYRSNSFGLADLAKKTLGVRMMGSAGISFINIFKGNLAGYFSNLQPWDVAAGSIIAEKLGFITVKFDGNSPSLTNQELLYCVHLSNFDEISQSLQK